MTKRTSPGDAKNITAADDLQVLVQDKRGEWRANGTKARRRQRRYENLLIQHLIKIDTEPDDD